MNMAYSVKTRELFGMNPNQFCVRNISVSSKICINNEIFYEVQKHPNGNKTINTITRNGSS